MGQLCVFCSFREVNKPKHTKVTVAWGNYVCFVHFAKSTNQNIQKSPSHGATMCVLFISRSQQTKTYKSHRRMGQLCVFCSFREVNKPKHTKVTVAWGNY